MAEGPSSTMNGRGTSSKSRVPWAYAITKCNNKGEIYPGDNAVIEAAFKERGNWRQQRHDTAVQVLWIGKSKQFWWDRWRPRKLQLVNHFRYNTELTTKDKMVRHIRKYELQCGVPMSLITPPTFILGARGCAAETAGLMQASADAPEGFWIVKPAALRSGQGIKVFADAAAVLAYTSDPNTTYVAQKYVARPLLTADGCKIDVRVFVLVDTKMQLWFYPEGYHLAMPAACAMCCGVRYARVSSKRYTCDPASLGDSAVHITNPHLQKQMDVLDEQGNMRDWAQFQEILSANGGEIDVVTERAIEIAAHAFQAVAGAFRRHQHHHQCFELFALDLIVDTALNVSLLEVNQDPLLNDASCVMTSLIPKMVRSAFSVLFDCDFPSSSNQCAHNEPLEVLNFIKIADLKS